MSTIPLAIQTPQPVTPLQTLGQVLQARDLSSQIAQRQQQGQLFQAEAAQRQKDLQDQNTLQDLMKNPTVNAKLHTGDFSPIEGKVQPKTLDSVRQASMQYLNSLNANTEATNKIRRDAHSELNESLTGLLTMTGADGKPDLDKINAVLPSTIQNLQAAGVLKNAAVDTSTLPTHISDASQITQALASNGGASAAYEKVLADQATAAKTRKDSADAQQTQQKADLQKNAIDAYKANPQAGGDVIDNVLPASLDHGANAAYKAAYKAAMMNGGPDAAQGIISAAASHASEISKATNPNILNADIRKAVSIEQATAPIKLGNAIAQAKAMREGDNPSLAGVPPAIATAATSSAQKLDQSYITAKGTTEGLGHILDLAEKGNKEAGSNLPLVGVETLNALNGIKRINSAEIDQYGHAGSLLDSIQGKIGKLVSGKPMPQDLLDDMRELHQTLGTQAYTDYTSKLAALNNRTGAKFGPAAEAPNISKSTVGMKNVSSQAEYDALPSGTTYMEDGKKFKKP